MRVNRANRPALLLIDIQQGFDDIDHWGGQRNNPDAEVRASELLHTWRKYQLPVFHIQHCSADAASPLHASNAGNAFKELTAPLDHETVIQKKVNSAFIGTDLKTRLDAAAITTLVIAGLTTDHCISTTVRMAGNLGYEAFLVADATATFNKKGIDGKNYSAELIHETALASLHEEFASVVTTDFIQKNI